MNWIGALILMVFAIVGILVLKIIGFALGIVLRIIILLAIIAFAAGFTSWLFGLVF